MGFAVLGPVRLVDGDRTAPIRSSLRRTLLARLLVSPNRPVPVDELVDAMWGVDSWEEGNRRLWFHVSKLRSLLDGVATIERSPAGYALRVDAELVDAAVFETLAEQARQLAARDPLQTAALVDDAYKLWSGTPYEDVIECRAVEAERRRLVKLHLDITELRFDLALAAGQGAAVVADLEAMVAAHQFRDRYRSQLMHALWQAGRVSEARLVYEAACRFGDEEFGGVVADHLHETMEAIDRGEEPRPTPSSAGPEPIVASSRREQQTGTALPVFRTSFIGRERLVERVVATVCSGGIVSLVGPAGVGKTRLAVEVAGAQSIHDAVGDVYFVDLAAVAAGSHVAQFVAQSIQPGAGASSSPTDTIRALLSHGRPLVLLDNCEHVIVSVAELVDELNDACPAVRWLATSRERLRLSGEIVIAVEPLSEQTATELLRQRAGLSDPDPIGEIADVHRRICRRLDCLPLAIELAAERLASLPAEELLIGLDDRFGLLTGGDRRGPARQQTLRAALDWSVEQLPADDKTVFHRSGILSGPFSVADVASLCDGTVSVDRTRSAVANLVDRNLIQHQDAKPPFRLLETMRHYGLAELGRSGERDELRLRHADHFVAKTTERRADAFGPRENEAVDSIIAQSGNHLQALTTLIEHGRWNRLADYAEALAGTVFWLRGAWIEPFRRLAQIAADIPDRPPSGWSTILALACNFRWTHGRLEDAERMHVLGVERNPDDPHVWIQGSYVARNRGDRRLAVERAHRAVAVADDDQPWQHLPALCAAAMAPADDRSDTLARTEIAELFMHAASRWNSATGRSYAEVAMANNAAPGGRKAAHHCLRAAVLAEQTRSPAIRVLGQRLQVAHLTGHDLDHARVVLLAMLRQPRWNDEVYLPTLMLQGAAGYFAEAGRMSLAVELAGGLPARMRNPARSAPVRTLAAAVDATISDKPSIDALQERLDRALVEVARHSGKAAHAEPTSLPHR